MPPKPQPNTKRPKLALTDKPYSNHCSEAPDNEAIPATQPLPPENDELVELHLELAKLRKEHDELSQAYAELENENKALTDKNKSLENELLKLKKPHLARRSAPFTSPPNEDKYPTSLPKPKIF